MDIALPATVPYKDSFLVIGGFADGAEELDTIYEYDIINDYWIRKPQQLQLARDTALAIMVDDTVANCS